jgi:hypothetical protein
MLSSTPARSRALAPPGGPGSRVPAAWVGAARQLRRELAVDYAAAELQIAELLRVIKPRVIGGKRFRPVPTHHVLRALERRWRELPALSRLSAASGFQDGKLRLGETRLAPSRMRFPAWGQAEPELAVAILMTAVFSQPPHFAYEQSLIADVGLHALARRIERGEGRDDDSVLADLAVLAHGHATAVAPGGEFQIPAGGGRWIGSTTVVRDTLVLAVRTFVA